MTRRRLPISPRWTLRCPVDGIEPTAWDRPGLGVWDVRSLVGHASRAMITVLTYLDQPAESEDIDSPQRYYALAARQSTDSDAVAERGRRAGVELGRQPAATGLEITFSLALVGHTTELATRIAVELDQGIPVLAALTGRRPLRSDFSVVA